jgi:hypothetical protein
MAGAIDQGRRGSDHALSARDREVIGELAASGSILEGQPGREPRGRRLFVAVDWHDFLGGDRCAQGRLEMMGEGEGARSGRKAEIARSVLGDEDPEERWRCPRP